MLSNSGIGKNVESSIRKLDEERVRVDDCEAEEGTVTRGTGEREYVCFIYIYISC